METDLDGQFPDVGEDEAPSAVRGVWEEETFQGSEAWTRLVGKLSVCQTSLSANFTRTLRTYAVLTEGSAN